jgi:hypothetical protein
MVKATVSFYFNQMVNVFFDEQLSFSEKALHPKRNGTQKKTTHWYMNTKRVFELIEHPHYEKKQYFQQQVTG